MLTFFSFFQCLQQDVHADAGPAVPLPPWQKPACQGCHWVTKSYQAGRESRFPWSSGRYNFCKCEHGCLKAQVFKWAQTLIARAALLKWSPWWPEQSESLLFHVLSPSQALQTPLHPSSQNKGLQCHLTDLMTPQDCRMCSETQGILVWGSSPLDHWILQVKTFSLCKLHVECDSQFNRD